MRVKQTHEFEIEVLVTRTPYGVVLEATEVDSDGGLWHYPKDLDDEPEELDTIPLDQVPEGASDEQIVDWYFNSPYGVS